MFVGTLAVYWRVVFAVDAALLNDVQSLTFGDGTNLTQREQHLGALYDAGCTFLVEETHEGFTSLEVHDGLIGLEVGIGTEGVGCCLHGFLVLRCIGSQGMLHAVTQLA